MALREIFIHEKRNFKPKLQKPIIKFLHCHMFMKNRKIMLTVVIISPPLGFCKSICLYSE